VVLGIAFFLTLHLLIPISICTFISLFLFVLLISPFFLDFLDFYFPFLFFQFFFILYLFDRGHILNFFQIFLGGIDFGTNEIVFSIQGLHSLTNHEQENKHSLFREHRTPGVEIEILPLHD
jgi:hypothetical protein